MILPSDSHRPFPVRSIWHRATTGFALNSSGAYSLAVIVSVEPNEAGAAAGHSCAFSTRCDRGIWNVGPTMSAVWARPQPGTAFTPTVSGTVNPQTAVLPGKPTYRWADSEPRGSTHATEQDTFACSSAPTDGRSGRLSVKHGLEPLEGARAAYHLQSRVQNSCCERQFTPTPSGFYRATPL